MVDAWDFASFDSELEEGERLLIDRGTASEVAVVNFDLTQSRYTVSFREAAEVLARHAVERPGQDLLVFPVLFVYRHWLELSLKELIVLGRRWRGSKRRWPTGHDLEGLWRKARPAIELAFPDDPAGLDRLASIVREFGALDPHGDSFRYAFGQDGETNLPNTFERINLRHFAEVMLKVSIQLDGAATGMHVMLDAMPDPTRS